MNDSEYINMVLPLDQSQIHQVSFQLFVSFVPGPCEDSDT